MPYIGNKTADTTLVEDNSITSAKIVDDAVITAKVNNDAVTVDKLNLISTGSVPSLEAKGTSGVTEGYIQLNCAENSHGIKLKSPPHSAGASYTLTFPNNDGDANQFLQTNGSGVLSFADAGGTNTPHFIAKRGSSNQTISNGANTVVQFNDEIIDSDNCYNPSTYTFQPNVAGVYYLAGSIAWNSSDDWDNTEVGIYKNASTDIDKRHFSNRFYTKGSVETIISLTTSDQITVKVYQASGSDKSILYGNWGYFMGYKLITWVI